MPELIKDNTVNMGELSRQNGKSELENLKAIMEILEIKAAIYDTPQKVILTFPTGGIL